MANRTVVVLGAGASRGVSYARQGGYLSPLDGDFFDCLGRLNGLENHQQRARQWVLKRVEELSFEKRESLERAFYTLHLRALMAHRLGGPVIFSESDVVKQFVVSIDAVLRAAHDTRVCEHHKELFTTLSTDDSIISFNYDLVAERALRGAGAVAATSFGPWTYGLQDAPHDYNRPILLKLHGSSNWKIKPEGFEPRTKDWSDFDSSPGYRAAKGGKGTEFAVFLPFWEKRVEEKQWATVWKRARQVLSEAQRIIVWGYSLPLSDVRTEQLISLCVFRRPIDLCVVDPSPATRARWRGLVSRSRFWAYDRIEQYLREPPTW